MEFYRMEINNGVSYYADPAPFTASELLYLTVRERENRLLSDAALAALPFVPRGHPDARLWRWRRAALHRLVAYFLKKSEKKRLQILDLGCGNGWMSNQLARRLNADVWAVDVNRPELEQGARVFGTTNPRFVFADIFENGLPEAYFDAAVLAGSFQYFPDAGHLLDALRRTLRPGGEIHAIDTNFYKNETQRQAAQAATAVYYARLGVPGMAAYYHHHLRNEVGGEDLNGRLPVIFLQKIKVLSPFPWLVWRRQVVNRKS